MEYFRSFGVVPNKGQYQAISIRLDGVADMYTKHAEVRSQQRAIPKNVIDLLVEYGDCKHDGHGCEIYFFNKYSKKEIEDNLGKNKLSNLDHCLDAYVVLREGWVITCGHRTQRIKRH